MQTVRTNLSNNASSQYTNFDFNSMCRFNGVILAAGAGGLFKACCGSDDNGTDIDAYFTPVKTNFGSLNKKRERHVYLAGECDGEMQVDLICDDKAAIGPYEVAFQPTEGQQRRRVKVGASDFAYASHKVGNVDGSNFSIDIIEAYLDVKPYGGN